MSEKRFTVESGLIIDTDNDDCLCDIQDTEIIVNTLNAWNKLIGEQQATINELKAKLKEKEEDEQLYANEILELREANKEFIQFKELGGDY